MTSKLSKKQMINDINIFFLKQGKICDGNIYKVSKIKLLQIIIDNDIPHINDNDLKNEIEETENFNNYLEIIYHNYMKYKNIPPEIIKNIYFNNQLNSDDLKKIIINYNLKYENDIKEISNLVNGISNLINNYNNDKKLYKTIPDIIDELKKISIIQ